MKVKLKNLKGEVTEIQLDETVSITQLKKAYQKLKNCSLDHIKFIYKGKNLAPEDTLASIAYVQTQTIIVMLSAKKQGSKVQDPKKLEQQKQQVQESQQEKKLASMEITIQQMCDMGFHRQNVIAALVSTKYQPNRAMELLMSGVFQNEEQEYDDQQDFMSEMDNNEDVNLLLNSEALKELKELLKQDPNADIMPQLTKIAELYPVQTQILSNYGVQEIRNLVLQLNQYQQNTIQISQSDRQAIERLQSLGFSAQNALQAYIACQKDENMAANYLFQQRDKGDDEMESEDSLY